MRILYECDLAGSKYHGMAYRIYQFSKEFVKQGHEVMIVAASYSHVRRVNPIVKSLVANEVIDGIAYKWLKTPSYKGSGIGRIIHMLIYNVLLYFKASQIAKEFNPDVVIASGVTPLDFLGCSRIAKLSNAKRIIEIGDLWPLTPIELGGYSPKHPFIRVMQWAEDYAYKNTDVVISLLPCAKEYMISHGLHPHKFNFIPNGIILEDWEAPKPLSQQHYDQIFECKKKGLFLVGFAGTHSLSNALFTLLNVAKALDGSNVFFVLTGNGPVKDTLKEYALNNDLRNVLFLSSVEKTIIPNLLKEMDVLYVGFQKQPLYRFGISPNKIYDYMMASKPIIQAIEAGNNLVKEASCGISVDPDNINEISKAILTLRDMSQTEREQLGKNGKRFVLQHHSYDVLTKRFLDIMINLIKK